MPKGHPLTPTERAARELEAALSKVVKHALESEAEAARLRRTVDGIRAELNGGAPRPE